MREIKKNTFRLQRTTKVFVLLFMGMVVLVGFLIFFQFSDNIRKLIEMQAKDSLVNVSRQNVREGDNQILSRQNLLRSIAAEISRLEQRDVQAIVESLKSYEENYEFYNMGIIEKNGMGHTTKGESLDLSAYPYFHKGIRGMEGVSQSYESQNGIGELNIFYMPVWMEGEVNLVLTATYRTEDFLGLLNIQSFNGKGGSIVLDAGGKAIALGENVDSGLARMAKSVSDNPLIVPGEKEEELISFQAEGDAYIAHYKKMDTNDWYLLTYVSSDYVYESAQKIIHKVLQVIIGLYFVLVLVSCLYIFIYHKFQKRIFSIVFKDQITGKKNYQYFKLKFDDLKPGEKQNKYLVNFDISKFKILNLLHGVKKGDQILQYVLRTFEVLLPGDQVYRYHGDIFVGILQGKDKEEIKEKIERLLGKIAEDGLQKRIPELSLYCGACRLWEEPELDVVYNNALLAKNEAKERVHQRYRFFDDTAKSRIEFGNIENSFTDALKKGEFKVWYQPKYDMRTGKICGAEALVRWQKEDGSLMPPGKFIPVFEATGQITQLDEEVLRIVCRDIREVRRRGLPLVPVSVNLSKLHIKKSGILDRVRELTEEYGISQNAISFEITESAAFHDRKSMDSLVSSLHSMGFEVDMDDYGTGSSTLKSLSHTNFDTLKLDKSFIDFIGDKKTDIIIQSTIRMAEKLKMNIIAEGVETEEQVKFLMGSQCFVAQGYYFSKPLDREDYFQKLEGEKGQK